MKLQMRRASKMTQSELAKVLSASYKEIFEQPDVRIPLEDSRQNDDTPPHERINLLFKKMPAQKLLFLQMIELCKNKQSTEALSALIKEFQENKKSVYESSTLCLLLEREGALERVVDLENHPNELDDVNEVEELQLLSAAEPAAVFWISTETGRSVLEEQRKSDPLRELFADDRQFLSIYQLILTRCEGEGESTEHLRETIDVDPVAQEHHLFTMHFLNKLEKCLALEWDGKWKTSEYGKEGLSLLKNWDIPCSASTHEKEEEK